MSSFKNFIAQIAGGDNIGAKSSFEEIISAKTSLSLESRKQEIASTLFQAESIIDIGEELEGNQHKLDKNKNGKVDADDFKKLRKEVDEDVDQIDELSKGTLSSYVNKAALSAAFNAAVLGAKGTSNADREHDIVKKRLKGIGAASKKLSNEGNQIDEVSPGLLARAAQSASWDEDGDHDPEKYADYAKKKFGSKIGKQIGDIGNTSRVRVSGYDRLAEPYRSNRSTDKNMVTKAGKLTKNAQRGLKTDLTTDSKRKITTGLNNSYEPEGNQIDEVSPGLLARAAKAASWDEYGDHDPEKYADYAKKKFGSKIGKQIGDIGNTSRVRVSDVGGTWYWNRYPEGDIGNTSRVRVSGYDRLAKPFRDNRSTNPNMVTKAGKLTKNAQRGLKTDLTTDSKRKITTGLNNSYEPEGNQIDEVSEVDSLATIAKKHGMKYTEIGRGAEMTHPTIVGKISINRYGEWHHRGTNKTGDDFAGLDKYLDSISSDRSRDHHSRRLADYMASKTLSNSYEPEGNQIDEISKRLKADYIKAASHDIAAKGAMTRHYGELSQRQAAASRAATAHLTPDGQGYAGGGPLAGAGDSRDNDKMADKIFAKSWKRRQFMAKAADQLASESVELEPGKGSHLNIGGARVKNDRESVLAHVRKTFPNAKDIEKKELHGWGPK